MKPKWSKKDEAALQALLARREAVKQAAAEEVDKVVDQFYFPSMSQDAVVRALIEYAPAVVRVLQPYLDNEVVK